MRSTKSWSKWVLAHAAGKQVKEIKAPMPGLVLEISVTDGQAVKEGDRILILEAMKMENSILIHADATIKKSERESRAGCRKRTGTCRTGINLRPSDSAHNAPYPN